jgi:hypothetical protein
MEDLEQLEFFDSLEKPDNLKALKTQQLNFKELWRFRQILFLVIYSIALLIIGFTFGVEKGRGRQSAVDKKLQKQMIPAATLIPAQKEGKITIQVASFKNSALAKEELQKLKSKGYNAYCLNSKQYTKVLVGPIKTREEAQAKLKTLKFRYPKCFIVK